MIPQLIANSLIAAAAYSVMGVGFAMVYWSARFFHFAHAVTYTISAYIIFGLLGVFGMSVLVAAAVAVAGAVAFGGLVEIVVYRQLRRRKTSPLGLLLASLGIMVAFQNVISLVFGDDVKSIRGSLVAPGLDIGGARVTLIQIGICAAAVAILTATWMLIHHTEAGMRFRAVTNDPELAVIRGVDSDRVLLWTLMLASGIAGIGAILGALDSDIQPNMGLRIFLMSVTATIVGGEGRVQGVALGAVLVGLAQNLGVLKLGTHWQDAIVFALLILFLLIKPQGFLGRRQRKVSV